MKPDRANILLVDDTPAKLTAMASVLEPLDQNIYSAHSGREALRYLLQHDFALILLDVKMGDLDGLETAWLIRQRARSQHTPIIFVTAFDQAEVELTNGYSLGAVDFIFSPINPEILRAKASVFVDLYQKTAEVKRLLVEAQEANRAKSEFLNMAAHELRTPLSVVAGYISMLADGSLGQAPPAWVDPLNIVHAKMGELNKLVDDILTAARIEVGSMPSELSVVDLRVLAQAACTRAEPRSRLLHGEVTCTVPRYPVEVEADGEQLTRVFDNLINNALTYCSESPRVHVEVADEEGPCVTVTDNGIGIPADMHARIFERFFRVNDASLAAPSGTGLGLYICRQLIQHHGGVLELSRSAPGAGSVFTVRLPKFAQSAEHPLNVVESDLQRSRSWTLTSTS